MRIITMFALILIPVILPVSAEVVMKITLTGSVSEELVATLSKIVFDEHTMIAGETYTLDEIEKVEFFDDQNTPTFHGGSNALAEVPGYKSGELGFFLTSSSLRLSIPEQSDITVSLFNLNGRKVTELFNGNAPAGALHLDLMNTTIASGVYSVAVKMKKSLFIRKIRIF